MKNFDMKIPTRFSMTAILVLMMPFAMAQQKSSSINIASPNKNISVSCDAGKMVYTISYKGKPILKNSKLGLVRDDENFSKGLTVLKTSGPMSVKESYTMLTAK